LALSNDDAEEKYAELARAPSAVVNGRVQGVFFDSAGEQRVAMHFWPWSLTSGLVVTAIGLLALVSLVRPRRG